MPLASIVPLLRRAQAGRYAVPLFLTPEMLAAEGTVAALEDLGAPAAVGVYAPWIERPTARALSAYLVALAEGARVPVALMLDHGTTLEQCARAIRYGFSDVMFDGSSLPYEENVAATRTVVRMAHAAGVGVEAELGHVGTGAEYQEMGAQRVGFTDPCTVAPYVEETGVDVLAVAFGSAHGVYRGEPHLDLALLGDLRGCTDIPLAMHGGSGLSAEQFRGAIAAGVSKINIFTELGLTVGKRLCEHATSEGASYFTFQTVIRDTFRERCAEYLEVFGAAGRYPEGMRAEGRHPEGMRAEG